MSICAPGTWETCHINNDQAWLGLAIFAVLIVWLLAALVVRRFLRSAAPDINLNPLNFPRRDESGTDWSGENGSK